jgi:membrane-bound lytic murein transglycosylase D
MGRLGQGFMTVRKTDVMSIGLAASTLALLGAGLATEQQRAGDMAGLAKVSDDAQPDLDLFRDLIPQDWDLPADRNERIDFFIDFLKGQRHDDMREWLERVGKYGPMIRAELRARDMPEDLLFLALIESGFDSNAYSPAHAVGIWQFISETGQRYGLEVTPYVDERRDPVKATASALTYLQQMHDRFGSWFLASAGYNTGENRVGRIMREVTGSERGTDSDYWRIAQRLPRETRDYVPLMIAAGHIAKDPAAHGFLDLQFQEPLRFATVVVPGGTALAEVARAAGVPVEAVVDLNPQLVRQQTPPGRTWDVRIPAGTQRAFSANFPAAQLVSG